MTKPRCAHCKKLPADRPRGLCWRCYYQPQIRAATQCMDAFWRNGVLIKLRRGVQQPRHVVPAAGPTDALPGSLEKVLVLKQRARRGEELWHPNDATLGGPVENDQTNILPLKIAA